MDLEFGQGLGAWSLEFELGILGSFKGSFKGYYKGYYKGWDLRIQFAKATFDFGPFRRSARTPRGLGLLGFRVLGFGFRV